MRWRAVLVLLGLASFAFAYEIAAPRAPDEARAGRASRFRWKMHSAVPAWAALESALAEPIVVERLWLGGTARAEVTSPPLEPLVDLARAPGADPERDGIPAWRAGRWQATFRVHVSAPPYDEPGARCRREHRAFSLATTRRLTRARDMTQIRGPLVNWRPDPPDGQVTLQRCTFEPTARGALFDLIRAIDGSDGTTVFEASWAPGSACAIGVGAWEPRHFR